jgi:transposase-like protein
MAITADDCPRCGRTGLVGSEREIIGTKAVTVFKCHNCNHTWRVPDEPGQPSPKLA